MIIEQAAPASTTAWLAAVGLAHLTKAPMGAVELYLRTADGGVQPSAPSRWVEVSGAWLLDIDNPARFADLLTWYHTHVDGVGGAIAFRDRDPWWRTRGNTTPAGIGAAIAKELATLPEDVDLIEELRATATARRTAALSGWVIDRRWVTLDPDDRLERPLIRYALAYIGATIAQNWPGHMIGNRVIGHLWDGQPSDHALDGQTVIVWEPQPDLGPGGNKYPAWWANGYYAQIPPAAWPMQVRERWLDAWTKHQVIGRTEAKRLCANLPEPDLTRSRTPLWLRDNLLRIAAGRGSHPAETLTATAPVEMPEPSATARAAGDQPLDISGVAHHTGLAQATIRAYVRDDAMPTPDGKLGQSQWWWTSTINAWHANRRPAGRPRTEPDHE